MSGYRIHRAFDCGVLVICMLVHFTLVCCRQTCLQEDGTAVGVRLELSIYLEHFLFHY